MLQERVVAHPLALFDDVPPYPPDHDEPAAKAKEPSEERDPGQCGEGYVAFPGATAGHLCEDLGVDSLLGNPKLYAVLLILCILLAGHYYTAHFTKKIHLGTGYVGSAVHEYDMTGTIESIARRRLLEFPVIDDRTLVGLVCDEMRQQRVPNVDHYEASIYAIVRRLRSDDDLPGIGPRNT